MKFSTIQELSFMRVLLPKLTFLFFLSSFLLKAILFLSANLVVVVVAILSQSSERGKERQCA